MKNREKRDLDEATQLLVSKEILYCQSSLVEMLLRKEILSYEEIDNLYDEETEEYKEVFEWWLVCERLAKNLKGGGEPVLESDFGNWWGRTCTGQALYLDDIIRSIAKRYFM